MKPQPPDNKFSRNCADAKQIISGFPTRCIVLPVLKTGAIAMAGKSVVSASSSEQLALEVLSRSSERGEAGRARAILLTLKGWTAGRIALAFGVREDTVRQWRHDFMRGGADALKARKAAGPPSKKTEAALRVATPLFETPAADRRNRTLSRLAAKV